jgi:hypothetical protein
MLMVAGNTPNGLEVRLICDPRMLDRLTSGIEDLKAGRHTNLVIHWQAPEGNIRLTVTVLQPMNFGPPAPGASVTGSNTGSVN